MKPESKFTIIINGQRTFVFAFNTIEDKAYLWTEGFITGKGNGWEFDNYKYETDSSLLVVNPF